MAEKTVSFILLCVSLFLFTSCKAQEPMYPYSHAEMVIPLTNDFYSAEDKNFDVTYTNGTAAVAVLRISFDAGLVSGIPETLTAAKFGAYWLDKTGRAAYINQYGEIDYCDFTDSGVFNLVSFYRSKYAYFVLLFAVDSELETEWRDKFLEFSKGVWFLK